MFFVMCAIGAVVTFPSAAESALSSGFAVGKAGTRNATVIVDGSSTVFRISKAAQEAFRAADPNITVVVDNHGTGGGFGRYLAGEVDIVDASRPAKPEEETKAKQLGYDWSRYLVGHDGITVVVHPSNTFVDALSVEQLKRLFEPGSKVKTWKDLNPAWPDREIVLFTPDKDSGTFEFFTEAVVGKARAQRTDCQQSSDDNILVRGVSGDVDGLGYFGFAYYHGNRRALRAVPILNGDRPVTPAPSTIMSKSYAPLSRPLYLYAKNQAILNRPEVSKFLRFYLTNVSNFSKRALYVAPTKEEIQENLNVLDAVTKSKP